MYLESDERFRYGGDTEPLLYFLERIYRYCQYECGTMDQKILIHKIMYITSEILKITYYFNINSVEKFKKSKQIHDYLNDIRAHWKVTTFQDDINEQCKKEGKREVFYVRTTNKYGPFEHEYLEDVSVYLHELLMKSTKGYALEV